MRVPSSTAVRSMVVPLAIGALLGTAMALSIEPRSPARFLVLGALLAGALAGAEHFRHHSSAEEDRRTRMLRVSLLPLAMGAAGAVLTAWRLAHSTS